MTNFSYRWRLVIHGGVDSYSRTIVYLKCADNCAATVLHQFVTKSSEFPAELEQIEVVQSLNSWFCIGEVDE